MSDLKNRSRSQKKTRTYPQHREIRSLKTAKKSWKMQKSRSRQQRRNQKADRRGRKLSGCALQKDYYDVVNKSCKAAKAEENSRYEKIKADLKSEHQKKVASLKDAEEIKAEKYVLKINCLMHRWLTNRSFRRSRTEDMKHSCINIT